MWDFLAVTRSEIMDAICRSLPVEKTTYTESDQILSVQPRCFRIDQHKYG